MLTNIEAAALLGCPAREIDAVADSPAGQVITTIDGTAMLLVPDDTPDAEGKTGLMLLAAPSANPVTILAGHTTWNGVPVFVSDDLADPADPDSTADVQPETDGLDDLPLDELKVIGDELGVTASGRSKQAQHESLVAGIRAARTADAADPVADLREALTAEVSELTDAELAERADTLGVDGSTRDELIAAIVAAAIPTEVA